MAKRQIDYAALYTLRKDGRYMGHYRDENGHRRAVYDRDPHRLYDRLQALSAPGPSVVTFRDAADSWERQHRDEIEVRTWSNYAPHLRSILDQHGEKPVEAINAQLIVNDLARAKAQGYSATVVNTRRSIYRMILDHAIVQGWIQFNPVQAVRLPRGLQRGKRTAPTAEQMQVILRSVDVPFGLFPFLLLCTGLRKSEALALTWADVDLKAGEISVSKSLDYANGAAPRVKAPKTDAGFRTVPIIDILAAELKRAWRSASSIYVFPAPASARGGPGGGLMTERGYEGAWLRYCQAVGLIKDGKPTMTAHQLRHGTATLFFEMGVDELTAQRILGHSRIEITREIYTDLRTAQKLKSVDLFNSGMNALLSADNREA